MASHLIRWSLFLTSLVLLGIMITIVDMSMTLKSSTLHAERVQQGDGMNNEEKEKEEEEKEERLRMLNSIKERQEEYSEMRKKYNEITGMYDGLADKYTAFIKRQQEEVTLDLDDFPELTGPRTAPVNTSINLVVICIGKSDKDGVQHITTIFPPGPNFKYLLFHYDNSTWHEFDWYNTVDVVAIRVLHKMKYWYLKRFLTPNMAKAFGHIIILDADVDFVQPFDPLLYMKVHDAFDLALSQPAHAQDLSATFYGVLYEHEGEHIGRYTDLIECGPAVVLSSAGYQCIYKLMQTDLTSGWGLGMLWVDYIRTVCKFGPKTAAVIDRFMLIHATESGEGTASSLSGFNVRARKEMNIFFQRFPKLKQGVKEGVKELNEPFGDSGCITAKDPANCNIQDIER